MGLSLIFIDKLIIIGNKQSLFLLHMIGSLLHVFLMNRLFAASESNLYDIAPGAVWRSVRHLSRLFFFVWSRLIGRRSFNARALLLRKTPRIRTFCRWETTTGFNDDIATDYCTIASGDSIHTCVSVSAAWPGTRTLEQTDDKVITESFMYSCVCVFSEIKRTTVNIILYQKNIIVRRSTQICRD